MSLDKALNEMPLPWSG